jgi:hypothetical protein
MMKITPNNKNTGPVVDGAYTYYGVYKNYDEEFACSKCKRVNPDLTVIKETPSSTIYKCGCNNQVRVERTKSDIRR